MIFASERMSAAGGAVRWGAFGVPPPICPSLLYPQHRPPPATINTQVKLDPAATARAPTSTSVGGGTGASSRLPSPSSPPPLCPQQRTPPVEVTTQVWELP